MIVGMKKKVCLRAPAKINLHLDILEKRADGFHSLLSLFQSVALWDSLTIRLLMDEGDFRLTGNFDFPVEENLITRAVKLFKEQTGIKSGLEITVNKEIPMGAGLGGGSSDAAAALEGLNLLFQTNLSSKELCQLGETLGSDVPFFIKSNCAIVEGRGEVIKPLEARADYYLLLIFPGFHVNTALAYGWLDKSREEIVKKIEESELLYSFRNRPIAEWPFINSFSSVLEQRFPEYKTVFEGMKHTGSCYFNISGSGSAVFGVYPGKNEAEKAQTFFAGKFPFVRVVKPLTGKPEPVIE